ncbi:hypothetical protein PRIPAC_90132 [Pristionchus pacificus]|uniref:GYF domain-containing protein n=1 Tax=Pristionchus pacificus TaxID=54126 RepID=A0A2A6CZK7_PRIPA|nr:hypothetical protein PRIPAC_90132 [Pristionchus pacificus]|eukprot:PDM83463.1 hypothetical protein PRIPAC_35095 [Pristionchus pacificus]
MVHRSPEDSPFVEEAPFPSKFPSTLSRKNSCEPSYDYYQEDFIYYRPPDREYFEGPFSEVQCQYWYKEGFFYNGLEFKFAPDGEIETLESLKARNGRECPFQEGGGQQSVSHSMQLMVSTLMDRVGNLSAEIDLLRGEKMELQISRKLEVDPLTNRVKELMDKDVNNDHYRRETERRLKEMQDEIAELKERSVSNVAVNADFEAESSVTTDGRDIDFSETPSLCERTAVDPSICEEVTEVRNELERLQNNVRSLDKFTFKISKKVEEFKCTLKVVDVIGEGLNSKDGVYDRLAYLEQSVEEIQDAIEPKNNRTMTEEVIKTDEEIVLPVNRVNGENILSDGSTPDEWYSPSREIVTPQYSEIDLKFASISESLAAASAKIWAAPENIVEIGEHADSWENVDEEAAFSKWNGDEMTMKRDELITPPMDENAQLIVGDIDKENIEATIHTDSSNLEYMANGLVILLQTKEQGCEDANDEDFENLTGAIKGAKMLQIAESLKQHFGKALICEVCSTAEKKIELKNAIEYFEHLNRAHFKKSRGADKMVVTHFTYLLKLFKAQIPIPISLAKRQYAEREKNKPWLKRDKTPPNGKTPGKKRK